MAAAIGAGSSGRKPKTSTGSSFTKCSLGGERLENLFTKTLILLIGKPSPARVANTPEADCRETMSAVVTKIMHCAKSKIAQRAGR